MPAEVLGWHAEVLIRVPCQEGLADAQQKLQRATHCLPKLLARAISLQNNFNCRQVSTVGCPPPLFFQTYTVGKTAMGECKEIRTQWRLATQDPAPKGMIPTQNTVCKCFIQKALSSPTAGVFNVCFWLYGDLRCKLSIHHLLYAKTVIEYPIVYSFI